MHLMLFGFFIWSTFSYYFLNTQGASLLPDIAPCTGKIILGVFERWENLLQNGILHLAFRISQLSKKLRWKIRISTNNWRTASSEIKVLKNQQTKIHTIWN